MEDKGKTKGQLTKGETRFRREYNILAAINRVFREALTCQTEEQMAKTSLHVAEELTGSKFGFIGEVNQAGRFDIIAMSDPGWAKCRVSGSEATRLMTNMEVRGIWGRVLKDEKPLIANDPAPHSDSIGTPEGHPRITSFLGVPLKEADRTFGMIALANKKGGYDRADQEAVEALSMAVVEALMRFRAEQAQRRSEERHRDLAETAPEVIFSISPEDGTLTSLNPVFEQVTGWSPAKMLDKPFMPLIHPDDQTIALEKFLQGLRGESPEPFEVRLLSAASTANNRRHSENNVNWLVREDQ